jgi:hypothetical protein
MMSGTSQATFNKLQLPTDISEKALQNPVNSAQLPNVQKHSNGDQGELAILLFFLYPLTSEVAYLAEALCYKQKSS